MTVKNQYVTIEMDKKLFFSILILSTEFLLHFTTNKFARFLKKNRKLYKFYFYSISVPTVMPTHCIEELYIWLRINDPLKLFRDLLSSHTDGARRNRKEVLRGQKTILIHVKGSKIGQH